MGSPARSSRPTRQREKRLYLSRDKVLDHLRQEFIDGKARIGAIVGPPGTGKTYLADRFADMFRLAHRAADVIHTYAWSPVAEEIVPADGRQLLIIIDDFDATIFENRSAWWRRLARRKDVRILFIGSHSIQDANIDFLINLPELRIVELTRFLQNSGIVPTPELLRTLQTTFGSNFGSIVAVVDAIRANVLTASNIAQSLEPVVVPGLVDPSGQPLRTHSVAHRRMVSDIQHVTDELLLHLRDVPQQLYHISPRKFEEVVAEILSRLGYEVELTPASKDGGKDIYAARRDQLGTFLYFVECKRYAPEHPVGVGLVKQLYATADAARASGALLATTSFFTRGARAFQDEFKFHLQLRDYFGIQAWLKSVVKPGA